MRILRSVPAAATAAVLGAAVLCSCSDSLPSSVTDAPVLSVATGLWPVAQVVSLIGGDKVAVDDVVPAGTDPLTYDPTAAQTDVLRSAGLVIEVGGGFQPALEQAASAAHSVTRLAGALGAADPYVWLDPTTMTRAIGVITSAMGAVDPQAAALFKRNAGGVSAQLQSVGIDFSSTFGACPGDSLVLPDRAFTAMAADYQLHDAVVGPNPSASTVSRVLASLPSNSTPAGISEPWVDDSGVSAVASGGGFKVHQVDTLVAAPQGVAAAADNYFSQMEQVLGDLSSALGCSSQEQ